jgi:3-oxoacyl-[acyl-carrier protein] reductase/bacilysin biosynthesis oxidoreductase BacG
MCAVNSQLQGKVALITGASRGIGKAVAERFAAEGVRLAICSRNEEDLQRAAEEIQSQTRADIVAVKANMARANDIRRFVATAVKKFSRIDLLVNNAGGGHVGGILAAEDEAWEYHLQLKLLGYVRMAREVIPHMKASGGGRIVNVIGMAGKEPGPLSMIPGVMNAALLNFTKSLARELAPDKIFVNAVNPGTTDTRLADETFASLAAATGKSPEELRLEAAQATGQGRIASAEEIAAAVAFLASDAAGFINGTSLNVDAGRSSGLW